MFKKIIIFLGIFSLFTVTVFAFNIYSDYTDQAEISDWAEESVKDLTLSGIMTGYADGSFGPKDFLNREQLATVISRYDQNKGRLYVNSDKIGFFNDRYIHNYDDVSLELNSDPANELVTYFNLDKKIKIEVPYNSNWGNENFILEPFKNPANVPHMEGFDFGPLVLHADGFTYMRKYLFVYDELTTAENLKSSLSNRDFLVAMQPETITINGYDVVKYVEHGIGGCKTPSFTVIGNEEVYIIRSVCEFEADLDKTFELLEYMVRSIEMI